MAYQAVFERFEKKYLLDYPQYTALKAELETKMTADAYGLYPIRNLYFDTEDFRLIRTSLEKPVYKEKLRLRSYGAPAPGENVFMELKKKFRGIVYKRRISLPYEEATAYLLHGERPGKESQILQEIDWFMDFYHPEPKVYLAYDRLAYFGKDDPELRVTFDQNIRWRGAPLDLVKNGPDRGLLPEDILLMEIKLPGAMPFWMSRLLSRLEIFPTSFSKYGLCYRKCLFEQTAMGNQKGGIRCA